MTLTPISFVPFQYPRDTEDMGLHGDPDALGEPKANCMLLLLHQQSHNPILVLPVCSQQGR